MAEKIPLVEKGGKLTLLTTWLANKLIGRVNALSNISVFPTDAGKAEVNASGVAITLFNTGGASGVSTEAHNLGTAPTGSTHAGPLVDDPSPAEPGISGKTIYVLDSDNLTITYDAVARLIRIGRTAPPDDGGIYIEVCTVVAGVATFTWRKTGTVGACDGTDDVTVITILPP